MSRTRSPRPARTRAAISLSLLVVWLAVGCGAATAPAPAEQTASKAADSERLRIIALERSRKDTAESYLVGAGDLLEVNVFDLAEMNRRVRVASSGYVQLPLIGAVKAAGRSEADLSADIAKRLARNYLQNPQVDVFVEEYKSQQVAVTGSVSKPGLYPLTRDRYTILDMISEAGGLTKEAGAMIQFIPAVSGKVSPAFEVASASEQIPMAMDAQEPLAAVDAIPIDLNDLLRGGNQTALNVPVAAGDVIFVPEAGSFTIEGWVDKPGTYPLTRNTTVLAALSSGGGALFPSRLGKVQVLRAREGSTGPRELSLVDLNAVREGRQPDVPLRSGDIVRVPGWRSLMVPWGAYTFVKSLISVGASIPIL